MKLISAYLAEEQIKKLKKIASKTGIKVSEHLRRAIDEYLKKFFIIIFLLLLPSEAISGDNSIWTVEDTTLQALYLGLLAADCSQTLYIARHPNRYSEDDSKIFIGKHPSKRDVLFHCTAIAIIHTAIADKLNDPYRTYWQSIFIIIESDAVNHNREIGIGLSLHY